MHKKSVLYVVIILSILGIIIHISMANILKFYEEQKFIFYWFLLSIPLLLLYLNPIFKILKNMDATFNQQKYILENISPQKGIIEDFIIYRNVWYNSNDSTNIKYKFIPIIKNLKNKKRYATYGDYNFSYCKYYWKQFFNNPLTFSYTSINGTEVKIGSSVNLYILEELPLPILKENNYITIYNKDLPYVGNIERQKNNQNYIQTFNNYRLQDCVYNFNKEKSLFEQPIVFFKGMTAYENTPSIENYKIFAKKTKKEVLFTKLIMLPFIPIVSLIITILLFCSNIAN